MRSIRLTMLGLCLLQAACAHGRQPARAAGGAEPPAAAAARAAEHAHAAAHELPATAGAGYTVADVRFMQNMIGHHAQAITMAALAPTHGAGTQLLRLAQKIDISQRDEIGLMERWLRERNQAVPDSAHAHGLSMPGMLTPDEMQRLEAARGREFEQLFLTYMIRHHEGALRMVEELFASPGAAQDSDLFRFVTDVDADQRDEIFVMQSMLDMLATTRGSPTR